MPATVAPLKKQLSSRKEPCFKSLRKSLPNYNGSSKPYSHIARKSLTMFDKTYRQTPMKATRRITRNNRVHRLNEVQRCSDIEQKEQYRLLIEQYRTKTLAETEAIFCRKNNVANNPAARENVIVDLSGIQSFGTSSIQAFPRQLERKSNYGSFLDSPITVSKSSSQSSTQNTETNASESSNSANTNDNITTSISSSHNPEIRTSEKPLSVFESSKLVTPPSKRPLVDDWFSPSSPYLCKSFVKDLMSSYGRRERERKQRLAEEETRARLLKEKREMKEELLSELLEARLNVTADVEQISELTPEMENVVAKALIPYPEYEVLNERFNITITREHMQTLSGQNWLNDEIINFYMELIVERSKMVDNLPTVHAMNTFFYPKISSQGYKSVRRWTKRVDLFSKDIIFFPIHLGVHWTLAVADFRSKELRYYDSMGDANAHCLQILKNYLASEHEDKKKATLDVSQWKIISKSPTEIPQQQNGSDCGVFACTFAEFISRKVPLLFQQSDMPLIRLTMVWEIMRGSLVR